MECLGSCPPNIATSEPVEPAAIAGNSKKVARRERNYFHKEDEVLCSAYLNVSKDPIQGANQTGDAYWKQIHQYFHEHKDFPSNRTLESLQHRWGGNQKGHSVVLLLQV
ncbi:hypothetical protein BAE44_0003762 [Dichanthelium oligosanthes]|uniref:No apical meristem-associated C-terminal domain-containing protein n=1 Tax=Dichanthelium oligosanthes TaxID=888268 RepID=A0A1E5WCQ9_9POAL|nr:hypothetical protein BAE44_0003762 [Dichanthelium oligosanthes]